ncbi:MAG: hypothetical protein IJ668_05105 [Selenomonadaceae bacterium]|nr:hypothetical protein [Selenomonadaceae bacterium]
MFDFKTKAMTLEFLSHHQNECGAKVLPLYFFTTRNWLDEPQTVWRIVCQKFFGNGKLIVRSSALNEDATQASQAGKFVSKVCPLEHDHFINAVDSVIASYDVDDPDNQILIQPALENVEGAGVAFTVDPNSGGNYFVINYDMSGSTSSITDGSSRNNRLCYRFKGASSSSTDYINRLCVVLGRLEIIFDTNLLDVEFAFKDGDIFIFQVRPLVMSKPVADLEQQRSCLRRIKNYIRKANSPKPFLHGTKALYSNMTDWNPAEMIGVHPKRLALSLYKELITDTTWAYQRDNYGYKRLRSFPLMIDFCGVPYIDVRVSFNSFIPSELSAPISEKLVNYYLDQLSKRPQDHDKVEFDIIFSCYTFDLPKRIRILQEHGFSADELDTIIESLRKLTNRIINSKTGLWKADSDKIKILEARHDEILNSSLDEIGKMYWLIEDCKRYGTLPFAGLARAGFIAVQILQSMVKEKIIDRHEYDTFMSDVSTVGSQMKWDFRHLLKDIFLKRYGHLRPGTYDITSERYDEKPDFYFRWHDDVDTDEPPSEEHFRLSLSQIQHIRNALERHGMTDDVLGLFTFIKAAIEGREHAKFVFTKNLSRTLKIFGEWCHKHGISREDAAFGSIQIIKEIYGTTSDERELLTQSIEVGRQLYEQSIHLVLPPLIAKPRDVEEFFVPDSQPTFITQRKVVSSSMLIDGHEVDGELSDKILLIPAADPGFDWIFSHDIAGFVTEYGGANSHMAIRAGELNIPAAIGVGQKLFNILSSAEIIEIDAALKQLKVLR